MRFFKGKVTAGTPEQAAVAERLRGIVGRGQAEVHPPAPVIGQGALQTVTRIFWTPDELAQESSSD